MPKDVKKSKPSIPDWANSIRELREKLRVNQLELGQRLHYSAMAISRWERGEQEPTDRGYIELGNLAGDPDCWYFWGRAGLHNENLLRVMPVLRERLQKSRFADFEVVKAGSGGQKLNAEKLQLVAIPVLRAVVAAHGEKGGHPSSLLDGPIEGMIAAPKDWCPNPAATSCLRVRGNSMTPLIPDGCIVAVDSSQTDHMVLNGKIVIAWHRNEGLTVSRFKRYDHTEILEPENHGYESITLSAKQRWKILARVLWWIGKAP
ncbi:MAG TPA: XRE family transcriptional regulator [Candidatus Acidoferrum sp.]|jgi:SOS-response transcriptional repressor LexA